ncbi:Cell division protein FtsA [hydrothermal vent metagenome]|uniref:Cell division protein FtsA n=1 Tax=hydrothermal vent metagenome TaxID=652676 RepID=A0A3B0TL89_9ZZZZ
MASKQKIVAVVDIGTTKVVAIAGVQTEDNKIDILGFAKNASKGVKRGILLNIDEAVGVLNDVISQVEDQFDGEISEVNVALAGQHVRTIACKGYKYTSEEGVVTSEDIQNLIDEVQNHPCDPGHKIYHIAPVDYIIDEEPGFKNPVGVSGKKIDARYKVLMAPESYNLHVEKALHSIRVGLGRTVISPVATAEAVLTEDEKEAGVVLVDIGGGITTMAIYYNGTLCYSVVIPFAGNVITNDIKKGCSILLKWAEQLKIQYGQAMGNSAEEDKVVTIPGSNGWEPKEISFKSLAFIIQARLEEIIDSCYFQIENSGYLDKLGAGIVLAGGTSKLMNLVQLVKYRTGLDARIGFPALNLKENIKELRAPEYFTALGLLKLSLNDNNHSTESGRRRRKKKDKKMAGGFFRSKLEKMSQQITMIFDEDDIELQ